MIFYSLLLFYFIHLFVKSGKICFTVRYFLKTHQNQYDTETPSKNYGNSQFKLIHINYKVIRITSINYGMTRIIFDNLSNHVWIIIESILTANRPLILFYFLWTFNFQIISIFKNNIIIIICNYALAIFIYGIWETVC